MPMVIRRAIRCGVRVGPFASGRWRDKFCANAGHKRTRRPDLVETPRFFFAEKILPATRLVADDGDLGVRYFQPHQAVIAVEQEKNLEIGSGDFEAFIGLAVGTGGSRGLYRDRTKGP